MDDALPGRSSIDKDIDGTSREIVWDPIFSFIFKKLPVKVKIPTIFLKKTKGSRFWKF